MARNVSGTIPAMVQLATRPGDGTQPVPDAASLSITCPVFAIHGHFYQPPREDPFTGEVARDPSAAPGHDWNDRISDEAYAPNVALGNLARIGWDLGPTIARWLREHRPALHDAMMSQARPHSLMAQGYHHAILPLASMRDRRTEIRWALRDVELRTGHRPFGLWLPEAAVDLATLRICAEEGVRWTILAPWQAGPEVDTAHPYRVELGADRRIVVVSYDAALSTAVSFDPSATADADRFAREMVRPRLRTGDGTHASGGTMALVCTDGELYGHHQPFRDLFLARLLSDGAAHAGIATTTPGEWLASLDPQELPIGSVVERTSWSCHHGIARWGSECGCTLEGRWKAPLRQAFDRIAGAIDTITETHLAALGVDAWAARDRYVDVASGYGGASSWAADELARAGVAPDPQVARDLATLMSAQASRLAMFASCGWFWEAPTRPETRQVLRFAAHAVRTLDQVCGSGLEDRLVDDLASVPGPRGSDGAELYREALEDIGQRRSRREGPRAQG
jgi:hypothetical protein